MMHVVIAANEYVCGGGTTLVQPKRFLDLGDHSEQFSVVRARVHDKCRIQGKDGSIVSNDGGLGSLA